MLITKPADIQSYEITDQNLFLDRRRFLQGGASLALGITVPPLLGFSHNTEAATKLQNVKSSHYTVDEDKTPYKYVTEYNNFYEFSTDKKGPSELSKNFKTRPWTIAIEGEVNKPKVWDIDTLIKLFPLEERVYRLRCVEAWSMVIPWVGFPLGDLVKRMEPTSRAKYIQFETLYDTDQMPGQKQGLFGGLDWPYVEGLRLDEALNPLSLLCVGLYGEVLPNQNGAPIRLIVPWKYGFKSIKSIVTIKFTEKAPVNTWQQQAPREYGFYANVNPKVDHPRWSQAKERRIGEWQKRDTLMFNGYAEQVAHLYKNMDLRRYY